MKSGITGVTIKANKLREIRGNSLYESKTLVRESYYKTAIYYLCALYNITGSLG